MKNIWESIRGYKRHAGAIIVMVPVLLQMFGVSNEESDAILKAIEAVGAVIWGIGWIDRGSVAVKENQNRDK